MTVHLIKLCVGVQSISQLVAWQAQRVQECKRHREPVELFHITRQTPKRHDELLDGGSIYWVIKGWLCARQQLMDLRPVTYEGVTHCALIYHPEVIRVRPRQTRAFQGWRYLNAADAPADMVSGAPGEVDDALTQELAKLGLL